MLVLASLCLCAAVVFCVFGSWSWRSELEPNTWREFVAAICGASAFLYFVNNSTDAANAGLAVFLTLMIPLFVLGGSSRKNWKLLLVLGAMLVFSSFRIFCTGLWDGSITVFCAFFLVTVLAAVCSETSLNLEILSRFFFSSLWRALPRGLQNFQFALHIPQFDLFSRIGCAAILLPMLLVGVFGSIFVLANPTIIEWLDSVYNWLDQALLHFDGIIVWLLKQNTWGRLFVFLFAFCCLCGFLAPRVWKQGPPCPPYPTLNFQTEEKPVTPAHFAMFWNSLFALIILFAVELIYEFYTFLMWRPPEGFDYGTYCQEGAFWLTMVLGLTTLVLAGFFRKNVCAHEKIGSLKRLAFIWIVENALLAVTIYIRLAIYVHQTGLTCLRVFGFFGTTAVAVGIFWMALKLKKDQPALWLINRYTWTVAALVWFYSILPVDFFVWKYNVAAFQAGNKAVLVHVADQRISKEGLVPLFKLLDSEDPIAQKGVAAVILAHEPPEACQDWRSVSLADARLRKLFDDPDNQEILEKVKQEALQDVRNEMKIYGEQNYR